MDEKVGEYIEKQKSPQKEICKRLRKIILKTFPKIKEEMKYGVPWYERYYVAALRDKVNLGFCIDGLTKKEIDLFEGQGKTIRHIKVFSVKDIDEKRFVKLLKITKDCIAESC